LIQIPDHIDSKYRFVILSALRARQLQGGSRPYIRDSRNKSTQLAQKEILQGFVKFRIRTKEEFAQQQKEEQEQ
jgi:DNA-directed RNA polymerase omega subunit